MRKTLITATIGILLYVRVGPASAQDADEGSEESTARARVLFNEGLGFADRSRWQEASDRFRAALQLRRAPAVEFNLASALVELGQFPEAADLATRVLGDPSIQPDLRERTETLRASMTRRGGTITVRITGQSDSASIGIDGYALAGERHDDAVPASAGPHVVTASVEGSESARQEVTVSRGGNHEVRLTLAPSPEQVAAVTVPPAPEPLQPVDSDEGGSIFGEWWFWAGLGAVAVATTVIILLVSTDPGVEDPVVGDFQPGVIRWE